MYSGYAKDKAGNPIMRVFRDAPGVYFCYLPRGRKCWIVKGQGNSKKQYYWPQKWHLQIVASGQSYLSRPYRTKADAVRVATKLDKMLSKAKLNPSSLPAML